MTTLHLDYKVFKIRWLISFKETLEKKQRGKSEPAARETTASAISVHGQLSDLLDVDRLRKDQSGVLLLELFQRGAEEHQHGGQLHLQHRLVNFDLHLGHACGDNVSELQLQANWNQSPFADLYIVRHFHVTCSLLSFSLLRISSTNNLAFSRSWRSFCQYRSASLAAETFSSTSGCKTSDLKKKKKNEWKFKMHVQQNC